jgi:hypothetical protein
VVVRAREVRVEPDELRPDELRGRPVLREVELREVVRDRLPVERERVVPDDRRERVRDELAR